MLTVRSNEVTRSVKVVFVFCWAFMVGGLTNSPVEAQESQCTHMRANIPEKKIIICVN